jgi:hypothetical protein
MLRGCAIFHPAWLLETILLSSLTPLVVGLLTFYAMVEHAEVEQIKGRATIHTSLQQLQPIHMAF